MLVIKVSVSQTVCYYGADTDSNSNNDIHLDKSCITVAQSSQPLLIDFLIVLPQLMLLLLLLLFVVTIAPHLKYPGSWDWCLRTKSGFKTKMGFLFLVY